MDFVQDNVSRGEKVDGELVDLAIDEGDGKGVARRPGAGGEPFEDGGLVRIVEADVVEEDAVGWLGVLF